jgi:hypothetical protein
MLSRVNTYNFHSNVKKIKKISVNQLFRQRVMASMIFTPGNNPKFLSDHVSTIFRQCDFLPKYSFKLYYFNYFEMLYELISLLFHEFQQNCLFFLSILQTISNDNHFNHCIINDLLAPLSLPFHEFQQNSQVFFILQTISNDNHFNHCIIDYAAR